MKCFYHSADLDGKCSAAIIKNVYTNIELIGINYGDSFPWDTIEKNERVYMVDFALQPFDDMIKLDYVCDLIWIDHHKTAIDQDNQFNETGKVGAINGIRRIGIGACALVWAYILSSDLPKAVRLLAEYDIWNHTDPETLPFQYGMRLIPNEPTDQIWKDLFKYDSNKEDTIIANGKTVLDYINNDNSIKANTLWFPTELDGLKLQAANFGPASSQFFDSVWDPNTFDAMCLFYWKPKIKKYVVSLYTDKQDVDVSIIAKNRGGGGHKGAAGFQCSELPFLL